MKKTLKIESLKNYVNSVSQEEFMMLANNIYMITDFVCSDYLVLEEFLLV